MPKFILKLRYTDQEGKVWSNEDMCMTPLPELWLHLDFMT